jgi:quinate dehydrogenase (quinone)
VVVLASMPLLRKGGVPAGSRAKAPCHGRRAADGGLAAFASMFQIHPEVSPQAAAATRKPVDAASEQKDWNHYGNSSNNDRFAALDQINVDNVNQLQVAWTFHTGDVPKSTGAGAEDQLTPLQVGDKVFSARPATM